MKVILPDVQPDTGTALAVFGSGENATDELLIGIAGAYYREPQEPSEPELFVLLPAETGDKIFDEEDADLRAMHVIASTEARVLRELNRRYPPPPAGGSYLYRVRDLKFDVRSSEYICRRRKRYYKTLTFPHAYVRLKRPLFKNVRTFDEIRLLCGQYGPIWIDEHCFGRIFGSDVHAERQYQVIVHRPAIKDLKLVRVNYNPEAFTLRTYREQLKAHEVRAAHAFPACVLFNLYACLHPDRWPSKHPFHGEVKGRELYRKYGWGNQKANEFSVHEVLALLGLTRKLWGQPWWRDSRTNTNSWTDGSRFADVVKQALQHVHGVEAGADADEQTYVTEARQNYDRRHERYRQLRQARENVFTALEQERETGGLAAMDPDAFHDELCIYLARLRDEHDKRPPARFSTYYARYFPPAQRAETEWAEARRLCRWLRTEARALSVQVPPASVKPMTPAAARQLQKQKERQRAERRRKTRAAARAAKIKTARVSQRPAA